jgi:hypothetical protein
LPWLEANLTLESLSNGLRDRTKGFLISRGVPELLELEMGRQRLVPNSG